MKKIITSILLFVTQASFAQTDCTPTANAGYSCYDYGSGTFSELTGAIQSAITLFFA